MIVAKNIDGVAVICIDDGKVNAFNFEMFDAVSNALRDAESADAIVFSGRKGVFSAGLDLKIVKDTAERRDALLEKTATLILSLLEYPRPVIAAVTGHAMALGALLLTACDYRIGAEGNFNIGVNATANGIALAPPLLQLLQSRINPRFAHLVILGAEIFDPEGACEAGYLDALAPEISLKTAALDKAKQWAALPRDTFAAHKAIMTAPHIDALRKLGR
ncbi:MAG: crotonase/enoyl-CoA hydratase family protein [Marinicaulis sp.]|nr:crotonase/enoyl-CoA hydratase family protein [Marinicaulis sp.]